jgi:hypothetical protein
LKWASIAVAASALPAIAGCAPPRQSVSSLSIIPRTDWGAVEPDHTAPGEHGFYDPVTNPDGWEVYTRPLSEVLNTIVVHHSALPLSDGPLEIQRLHMQNKGFADIGYHFIVDVLGQIYAGRSLNVRGAHTGGHNTGTVGIVLLGNFEEIQPAALQLASLKTLCRALADEYAIGYLAGHRDFQPGETVCPGKYLEPLLPGLAAEIDLKFGTAGYVGPKS